MNDEIILKLLKSSNLDDIKLGVLYLGKKGLSDIIAFYNKYGDRETLFRLSKRISHNCTSVPGCVPEHVIQGTDNSIVIFSVATTVYTRSERIDDNTDEFF